MTLFGVLGFVALFVALLFCTIKTFVEVRAGRYWWAAAAFVSVIGICAAPFPKQTINIDFSRY